MTAKKSRSLVASAVSLALSSMMLSAGVNAGIIDNSNNLTPTPFLGACGDPDTAPIACVGAWDLGNVQVKLFHPDGTEFGTFLESADGVSPAGTYTAMALHDSFSSWVYDWENPTVLMAKVGGKVWPVGEPTGIKAVYGDTAVKHGKPQNCIINTSYLDAVDDSNPSTTETSYLDTTHPEPVICSSGFQTHKRFKIAMQPATVEGVADGAEGKPIDLVFNVTDSGDGKVNPYQVFSKINNYTGKRLKGYIIQVGTGTGTTFLTAAAQGIEQNLFISLGIGEGASDLTPGDNDPTETPNGSNLFDDDGGFASFSHGLFGPIDKHFPEVGFFDERTAGFTVEQVCSAGPCPTYSPFTGVTVPYSDTIRSVAALPSNYVEAPVNFGDWLHSGLAPKAIYFDADSDPYTDNDVMAYWNGTAWVKNYASGFAAVTATELNAWAADPRYSVDVIEDTLNLGINYIVNVGDGIPGGKVTIRIIPVVADAQNDSPVWLNNAPASGDLLPVSTAAAATTSTTGGGGGGGGCAIGGDSRFDPTLPALLAMGLGFFGWRRFKAGK